MSNEEVIDMPENIPTLIVIPVITALTGVIGILWKAYRDQVRDRINDWKTIYKSMGEDSHE